MRTRSIAGALLAAAALTIGIVGVVAAHNISYSLTCGDGLVISLSAYNTEKDNSVSVHLDGVSVADESDFNASFSYSSGALDPYVGHTAHIVVNAWDDTTVNSGPTNYSFDVTLSIQACKEPTEQPPTEQPPTEQPPTEQPPTEQPPTEQPPTEQPSFFQSVEAATDVPTEPNTATVGDQGSGPSDSGWLFVAALGVLLASVVVLTPARIKNRR